MLLSKIWIKLADCGPIPMRRLLVIFLILVFGALVFFGFSLFTIYSGVKTACLKAKEEYRLDCVDSLIAYVNSEKASFREKNSAIWALGQIADKKALPFLEELNDSLPAQESCQYDHFLCRYEVEKAIKWCREGNITHWMYRYRDSWK